MDGDIVTPRLWSPEPLDGYTLSPGQSAKLKAVLPESGAVEVELGGGRPVRAGSLPGVTIAAAQGAMRVQGQAKVAKAVLDAADEAAIQRPPRRVRLQMLGQDWVKALGGVGYAFQLSRTDGMAAGGPARVSLDFRGSGTCSPTISRSGCGWCGCWDAR